MNKKMYFLRKGISSDFIKKLGNAYSLDLVYKDKSEMIFKNNLLMIVCKKKYISVLVYDGGNYILTNDIINKFSK